MLKYVLAVVLCVSVIITTAAVAIAQAPAAPAEAGSHAQATAPVDQKPLSVGRGLAVAGACIGAGLAVMGGGFGIGRIGGSILESIARQPEASGTLFAPMIITAAMVEGGMLFAIVISLLASL